MNKRATYLVQILEKIGTPLMAAVIAPVKGQEKQSDLIVQIAQDTQNMAELVARTVSTSIALSTKTKIEELGENSDALRVALAGLSAPLVADLYRAKGTIPDEKQIERVVSALNAVIAFSENFTPGIDEIARLSSLQASGEAVDKHQIAVQYLQALTPVVNAVPDAGVATDIAKRLNGRAKDIRTSIAPEASGAEASRIELGILRALGQIYAACYAELPAGSDKVWETFNLRSEVLRTLTHTMITGEKNAATTTNKAPDQTPEVAQTAPSVAPPPAAAAAPVTPPPEDKPAAGAEPPPAAPPASSEPPAQQATANPMSMFAKKKPEGEEASSAPPVDQPPAAPVAPPPAQAETPVAPVAPPPSPPPAEPPAEKAPPAGDSSNPMSFFSSKPKSDDE